MKILALMILGLGVVGCGKQEQADTDESTPTTNTNKVHGTTAKPVKELTLEEKVVGTYEGKIDGYAVRLALLDNGVLEDYNDSEKRNEEGQQKWKVVDGEIHADDNTRGDIVVLSINKDGSLTAIATIDKDGKRKDIPKDNQKTFKKIK